MSKAKLKAVLQSMDKDEVIKLMLELYSAKKEAKEFLDYYAEPNESQKLDEYKLIIGKEFYPSNNRSAKLRFSVCRKAVSDFKKLSPSHDSVAELMVFYVENACRFTYEYGDLWEQYYDSVVSNFESTLRFIALHGLWDKYDSRIKQCIRWVRNCGWGVPYAMKSMYEEMMEGANVPTQAEQI